MSEIQNQPTETNNEEESSGSMIAVLGVLFLPAMIVAAGFYMLLRKGHYRLSIISRVAAAFIVIMIFLWFIIGAGDNLMTFIENPMSYDKWWPSVLIPVLIGYSIIGAIVGVGICWWEIKQMQSNPHRLRLPGSWTYNFKFKKTPAEKKKLSRDIENLKNGMYVSSEAAPLGINEDSDEVAFRYYDEAVGHTLVTGASGSGKTISLLSLILSDIQNQKSIIIIDMKRTPEFSSKVAAWCKEYGSNFHHFASGKPHDYDIKNSEGQSHYDPLVSGSPGVKADMILGMREYDTASAVYKGNMQQLLQVLFAMLDQADRSRTEAKSIRWGQGGFEELASVLYKDNIKDLLVACEGRPIYTEAEAVVSQLNGKTPLKHAFDELAGQIRTIRASEYGDWLKNSKTVNAVSYSHRDDIDIFDLTSRPGNVILFSLNSDSEPVFAKYMGSLILSDVTNTSAKRRNSPLDNQLMVYVDEFQTLPTDSVKGLIEKARGSKMAVTLALQSFDQIVTAADRNGESYLGAILDTVSNFIVHAGMDETSAERISRLLGKHKVTKYIASNKNQSFMFSVNWRNRRHSVVQTREEEDWRFPPARFLKLSKPVEANGYKSTAVFVNKACSDPEYSKELGSVARTLWMVPDGRVLNNYYDPNFRVTLDGNLSDEVKPAEFYVLRDKNQLEDNSRFDLSDDAFSPNSNSRMKEDSVDDGGFSFVTDTLEARELDVLDPEMEEYQNELANSTQTRIVFVDDEGAPNQPEGTIHNSNEQSFKRPKTKNDVTAQWDSKTTPSSSPKKEEIKTYSNSKKDNNLNKVVGLPVHHKKQSETIPTSTDVTKNNGSEDEPDLMDDFKLPEL